MMNYRHLFLLLCASIFASFHLKSQVHGPSVNPTASSLNFEQVSEKDSLFFWQEQINIHLNKKGYAKGDAVFFKADLFTGPSQVKGSVSNVLSVELLDDEGKVISHQNHEIENGSVSSAITIPKKTKDGLYYIRAYTQWMLNYGNESLTTKPFMVKNNAFKNKRNDFSAGLTIVSEGDSFVAGLKNKLIISSATGNAIQARLVKKDGSFVKNVVDYSEGIGVVEFVPQIGENYYLDFGADNLVELPTSSSQGVVMQATTRNPEKISLNIQATEDLLSKSFVLKGTSKGKTYVSADINFDQAGLAQITLPAKGLPNGMLELYIEDGQGEVWAKRPIDLLKKEMEFSVSKNEEDTFFIELKDKDGNPLKTNFTLAVNEVYQEDNILFAQPQNGNQYFADDLALLSNRTSNAISIPFDQIELDQIEYGFQQGIDFYGQAYDLNNTLLSNKKIQVLLTANEQVEVKEVTTNGNGLFWLKNLKFDGEINLTFRTQGEDTSDKLVKVIPYELEVPALTFPENKAGLKPIQGNVAFTPKNEKPIRVKSASDFEYDQENLISLNEVTLVAKKVLEPVRTPSVYGIEPAHVMYQDPKQPKTLPELFLGIPGVRVIGLGSLNPFVVLGAKYRAGVNPPLWVLDGVPIGQPIISSNNNNADAFEQSQLLGMLEIVTPFDIDRIELLSRSDASIYGANGSGGVILVYTKSGAYSSDYVDRKQGQLTISGFHKSIDFDTYISTNKTDITKSGVSKAIYWNPKLSTDENGEALIGLNFHEKPSLKTMFEVVAIIEQDNGETVTFKKYLKP